MLKILQTRLQQYMNRELPDVQAGFRKGGGTRDQIANIHWIIKKARELQKSIYFCSIDYAKAFDCVDHNKLWKKFWKRWEYQTTWPIDIKETRITRMSIPRYVIKLPYCKKQSNNTKP